MNLYLISQKENNDYETFDSAVVAANTAEEARLIHPSGENDNSVWSWTSPEFVKVKLIGTAIEEIKSGVILASYNAG